MVVSLSPPWPWPGLTTLLSTDYGTRIQAWLGNAASLDGMDLETSETVVRDELKGVSSIIQSTEAIKSIDASLRRSSEAVWLRVRSIAASGFLSSPLLDDGLFLNARHHATSAAADFISHQATGRLLAT